MASRVRTGCSFAQRVDAVVCSGERISMSIRDSVQAAVADAHSERRVLFGHENIWRSSLCGCGLFYYCFHHSIVFIFFENVMMRSCSIERVLVGEIIGRFEMV